MTMTKCCLATLLIVTAGFAQQTSQEQPQVSPQDVQKATEQMKRALERVDQNAAKRAEEQKEEIEAAGESVKQETQNAVSAATKAMKAMKEESERRSAADRAAMAAEQRAAARLHLIIAGSILLLSITSFILLVRASRKGRSAGRSAVEPRTETIHVVPAQPPLNPTIDDLRKLGTNFIEVRFKRDGSEEVFNCVVELREKENDLVRFTDYNNKVVRWSERFAIIPKLQTTKQKTVAS